ncbi:MAG TPA: hypothetical protein VK457_05020 [Chloroflexota bacterium]|jgi:hypothetical protein|nr:hypothetical protein [Chloroflexota bacterium]
MMTELFETLAVGGDKLYLAIGQVVPGWAIMSAVAGSYVGLGVAIVFALRAPLAKARRAVRADRRRS